MIQQTITCDGCGAPKADDKPLEGLLIGPMGVRHACGRPCRAKVLRALADQTDADQVRALAQEAAKKEADARAAAAQQARAAAVQKATEAATRGANAKPAGGAA